MRRKTSKKTRITVAVNNTVRATRKLKNTTLSSIQYFLSNVRKSMRRITQKADKRLDKTMKSVKKYRK